MQDGCESSNCPRDMTVRLVSSCKRKPAHAVLVCPALGVLFMYAGCSSEHLIRTLSEGRFKGERFSAARRLAAYHGDKRATEALVAALGDRKACVRFAAAEALESHFTRKMDSATRKAALLAVVDVLDDTCLDTVCVPLYGPFLPGLTCTTPSVRSRALLTLVIATGKDCGLDKVAWRKEIEDRFAGTIRWPTGQKREIGQIETAR